MIPCRRSGAPARGADGMSCALPAYYNGAATPGGSKVMSVRWLMPLVLIAGLLSGCAGSPDAASEPPVPAGMARLYFYRVLNPYDPVVWTEVALNGAPVGSSGPGRIFYRDVAPGTYEITAHTDELYPHQFKTVAVAAGSTTFVKIEPQPVWNVTGRQASGNTFSVSIIEPSVARHEIEEIRRTGHLSG